MLTADAGRSTRVRSTVAGRHGRPVVQPVPRWFGALVVAASGAVAGAGLVGLVLAVAGVFVWGVAVVAGVVGASGAVALLWRSLPSGSAHGWAVAAVVVAVAFVGANWDRMAESVVLERDPGIYTNAARWLDRDGSLLVDAGVGPFADAEGVSLRSRGMYEHGSTQLEFQSNHLTPVLLATGYGAAGVGGLQRVPLALVGAGLLAVWALAARVTGRGAAATVAVAALAVSMPFVGVARDTLSEPVVLLLLWSALWLWTVGTDRAVVAAGVLVGTCLATRIDAAAYLVPVPIVLALHGRRSGWRLPARFAIGLVPGAVVAALDVGLRSRGYVRDLDVEVVLLYGLLVLAVAAGVVVARWSGRTWRLRADVLAGAAVAVLLALWFVRPEVQTVRAGASSLVANVQGGQGLEIDGRRRYHELSMQWQAWYLGVPLMAAAVVGAGIVVRRLALGVDRALLLPLAALGASTALYLYRPAISPDHLWAMRRFVPAALPMWCVLAGVAVVALLDRLPRSALVRSGVSVAAAALAVVPSAARTWPVRDFQDFDGVLALVERTCATVGPDAAVVLPRDDDAGADFTQTIRSWCGVPVGIVDEDADLEALAAGWAAQGRQLWLVQDGDDIEVAAERMLEDTLTRPPNRYFTQPLGLDITRVGGG